MHSWLTYVSFGLSLAFLLITTAADVHATYIGIKLGEAVEGNRLIVWLFGTKPTYAQDWIGALLCDLPFVALGAVGLYWHSYPLFIPGCFCMGVYGVRRLKAVAAWKKLR